MLEGKYLVVDFDGDSGRYSLEVFSREEGEFVNVPGFGDKESEAGIRTVSSLSSLKKIEDDFSVRLVDLADQEVRREIEEVLLGEGGVYHELIDSFIKIYRCDPKE